MTQQSQNASLETLKRIFKKLLKWGTIGALGFSMGASLTACNKTGQTTTPTPNPDPKPPIGGTEEPVVKTVTIDKIYNDNFDGTNFSADIKNAQTALANKVFADLNPIITNITYDEDTKELTFAIAYTEDNIPKSGSMTFIAPELFQSIRGREAKAIIYERAQLIGATEVEENKINEIKAKIESAIDGLQAEISTAFTSVKTSDVTVEKEQIPTPIETISFDELILDELGEFLGKQDLLREPSKIAIQQNQPSDQILDDFKIAIEDNKLIYYYNMLVNSSDKRLGSATYKGSASEFEDLIYLSTNPVALLNKHFSKDLQQNLDIEINGEEYRTVVAICNDILVDVNEQIEKLSALNYKNFSRSGLARHNNALTDEEALKFALKLGYTADEVLGVYVGTTGNAMLDDEYFNTGYWNGFTLSVFTNKNNVYSVDTCTVNVPHYTNSTQADYYRYFLEGERGTGYITRNQSTKQLYGIIIDFGNTDKQAQNNHQKKATFAIYDVYLPAEFNK